MADEEWKRKLTPEQYRILREKGTEAPFSGEFVKPKGDGTFSCVACGNVLFKGDTQYESRAPGLIGWPSFADIAHSDAVELVEDVSLGMQRTEVVCKKCHSHLGHVFEGDNDSPTGKHYCINSVCLNFNPNDNKQ
jgi:peptide-methionine (R)-S-oxide reductase